MSDWFKTPEQLQAESLERNADKVRRERDNRIAATDHMMMPDYPNKPEGLEEYRQSLRDVPQQDGFPYSVEWPKLGG